MGKDDTAPLAAGNAEIGFFRLSRSVDDTAHDGNLNGHGQMRNGRLDFFGKFDELNLRTAAGRTGNEGRSEAAQSQGAENGLSDLDFFRRIIRKGYADRIADALV